MVLEHLIKPKKVLESAITILNLGGFIADGVPNINGVVHKIQKKKWDSIIPPEYLIYFSEKTLKTILIDIGLKPVFIGTIPLYAKPNFKIGLRTKVALLAAK